MQDNAYGLKYVKNDLNNHFYDIVEGTRKIVTCVIYNIGF